MNKTHIKLAICVWSLLFIAFAISTPAIASAQIKQNPPAPKDPPVSTSANKAGGAGESIAKLLCAPKEPGSNASNPGSDVYGCINQSYKFIVVLGSIGAVFWLIVAGYLYMASDGSQESVTKAKEIMVSTVAGMFIILMTFVFLRQLNPEIVNFPAIDLPTITNTSGLLSPYDECILRNTQAGKSDDDAKKACEGLSTITGGNDACALPLKVDAIGYNSSVHNSWDDPQCEGKKTCHRTVRYPPNSPPPEGAVDVRVSKSGTPVYSPISGKVEKRVKFPVGPGSYVSIASNGSCSASSACANLGHFDPSVNEGDIVRSGQQIGVVAANSGSLGPVLHVELKLGGQWIIGDGKGETWTKQKAACNASGSSPTSSTIPSGMVNLKDYASNVVVDMRYATTNNFTGKVASSIKECYVTKEVAQGIKKAADALNTASSGSKLHFWDCYRTQATQQFLWDNYPASGPQPKGNYVHNPANGPGNHQNGKAVDLTIDGADMPSNFDEFGGKGKRDATNITAAQKSNRTKLQNAMKAGGFDTIPSEWWHFDYTGNSGTVAGMVWPYGGPGLPSGEITGSEVIPSPTSFLDPDCSTRAQNGLMHYIIKKAAACYVGIPPKSAYKRGERFRVKTARIDIDLPIEHWSVYEGQSSQPNSGQVYGADANGCATFSEAGCGPTAYSMLLQRLNQKYPGDRSQDMINGLANDPNFLKPWELGQRFVQYGFRNCPTEPGSRHDVVQKTFNAYFPNWHVTHYNYVERYGENWANKNAADLTQLKSDLLRHLSLANGYAIAVVGKSAPYTMKGHFILLFGACTGDAGCGDTGISYINVADSYAKTDYSLVEVGTLAKAIKAITYVGK